MMRNIFIAFLLLLSGCFTPVTDLESHLPKYEYSLRPEHKTIDSVLKYYFTDEAYEEIKDIPFGYNKFLHSEGFAPGTSIYSSIWSVLTGNGLGRKVVFSPNGVSIGLIIHEYMHHLDDITRDGDGNFILVEDFEAAYRTLKTSNDPTYNDIYPTVEKLADNKITDWFGVGYLSEHIAYMSYYAYLNTCPWYIGKVYSKVLRNWQHWENR